MWEGERGRGQGFNRVAGVGENDKALRSYYNKGLCTGKPLEAKAASGIIIHVASVNEDPRNAVDIVIPWIHRYTKEENTKGSTHINAVMDRERWSEVRTNFVQDLSRYGDSMRVPKMEYREPPRHA